MVAYCQPAFDETGSCWSGVIHHKLSGGQWPQREALEEMDNRPDNGGTITTAANDLPASNFRCLLSSLWWL